MLLLLACITVVDDEDNPVVDDAAGAAEGDDPGECTDGADNDLDGDFDCDDTQCAASPDCTGSGNADTDSDSDSDTDTDTGDAPGDTGDDLGARLDEFASYELAYSFAWDFDDAYESYLEAYGLGDCVTTYAGSGVVYERVATRLTFIGPWAPSDTDCNENLVGVLWYDERRDSYASFTFSDDLSRLDDWVQHLDAGNHEPVEEPSANQQWYITEMAADFDLEAGTAHYTLDESITVDIIPVVITHTLDVSFAR
ncbi:MAG: hypothetical protein FJ102_05615 [Deltaproteobacteria bacterium]|nr:hypothetical protein [Deltaproteobacteria bacterium]